MPKKVRWIQEATADMKEGAFTKQSLRQGETPVEYAADVLAHPEKHTPKTRKRAQFVKNVMGKKFIQSVKKLKGGSIESAIFNTIVGFILQYLASHLTNEKLIEFANKAIYKITSSLLGLPTIPDSTLGVILDVVVKPLLTTENFLALRRKITELLDSGGEIVKDIQSVSPSRRGRGKGTWREKFLAKYDLEDKPYSIKEVAEIVKMPEKALQESYNRGVGAWKTNPESVRLQKDFSKNPNMKKYPRSARLTKEQWGHARMIAFAMKSPSVFKGADRDIAVKFKLV